MTRLERDNAQADAVLDSVQAALPDPLRLGLGPLRPEPAKPREAPEVNHLPI